MTSSASHGRDTTVRICFLGLMAAIVFVVNYLRIPFMGTQLHMTNALCALCGPALWPRRRFSGRRPWLRPV